MPLKYSRQREEIKNFLAERKDHPTAEMVYRNVRNRCPNISLATVYRNLSLLADTGEIARLRVGDGTDHFDADTSPHYHFVCTRCGAVMDVKTECLDAVVASAGADFDGRIEGHVAYFYGVCGGCSRKDAG